jgi:hypothetical protein
VHLDSSRILQELLPLPKVAVMLINAKLKDLTDTNGHRMTFQTDNHQQPSHFESNAVSNFKHWENNTEWVIFKISRTNMSVNWQNTLAPIKNFVHYFQFICFKLHQTIFSLTKINKYVYGIILILGLMPICTGRFGCMAKNSFPRKSDSQ